MTRSVAFQTKARTVDHLGREQIADTPTAISELWKNSFDAYARSVSLNIFDESQPVAVLDDDGHGMNVDEFIDRWLVVGTESKASGEKTPIEDRNGLTLRPRLGQKGIGRLSCANLGPILLLLSKRRKQSFVAALLDWRLFENPFLNLSDIQVPVVEFEKKDRLFKKLPELVEELRSNLAEENDTDRAKRLSAAWTAYDELYLHEAEAGTSNRLQAPSVEIAQSINNISFSEKHLKSWPVWSGDSDSGTALLVSQINYDLLVQLNSTTGDSSAQAARERFFETLSSFVDPFVKLDTNLKVPSNLDFSYAVKTWRDGHANLILSSEKQFDRRLLEGLEHQLEGTINSAGVFQGKVKAFGKWIEQPCRIEPPKDLSIPSRADTKVGPVELYIGSMEFTSANTTLPRLEFQRYSELAERYAGFMVFRDGLRVLPYGRTDNDFFEIESRRTKNAGREFWNHRQMFGRLAISRDDNPNLKDKAGREGILDNIAAKTLKLIVANILKQSARLYFGSASSIRKEVLPEIRDSNKAERAREARNKLRKRQRREFRSRLRELSKEAPRFLDEVEDFAQHLTIKDEASIEDVQSEFETLSARLKEFRIPGAPKSLGSLEDVYADYRHTTMAAEQLLKSAATDIEHEIERLNPTQPKELLERQAQRHAQQISKNIRMWSKSIEELQKGEFDRIRALVNDRKKQFDDEVIPLLLAFDRGDLAFADASQKLQQTMVVIDADNAELFQSYISALESLKESIDLEHLAAFGLEEAGEMRAELDRLTGLAQLGIAVEIVGHELQSYDDMMGAGLRRLPAELRNSEAARDIEFAYEGLTDQLRFLSPLRLAGQKIQRWISGEEISNYLLEFFKLQLANNDVSLKLTPEFKRMEVFDQQSRLLPVFINLINNSLYWVSTMENDGRTILLDTSDGKVIVSDNGPGVDPEDQSSLFSLFFTKKASGGRGVGLYLSKANLAAGGHKIRYEPDVEKCPLPGATFVIEFQGARFDGE